MTKSPTDGLAPCPFCGGEARIVEGEESAYVQCQQVKMHVAIFYDGDNDAANEVARQWNRRPPVSAGLASDAAVEAAKAELFKRGIVDVFSVRAALNAAAPFAGEPVVKPQEPGWKLLPIDLETHLGDFWNACVNSQRVAAAEGDEANSLYWLHQLETIKRVRAMLSASPATPVRDGTADAGDNMREAVRLQGWRSAEHAGEQRDEALTALAAVKAENAKLYSQGYQQAIWDKLPDQDALAAEITSVKAELDMVRAGRRIISEGSFDTGIMYMEAQARADALQSSCALLREALTRLRITAVMLHQNAAICATNHHGHDTGWLGLPGWLADAQKDIDAADAALA